jgi:hypothetical protein
MPVIDDFQQITSLLGGQRRDAPIVEYQHLHPGQALEHTRITAVTACQAKGLEPPR